MGDRGQKSEVRGDFIDGGDGSGYILNGNDDGAPMDKIEIIGRQFP